MTTPGTSTERVVISRHGQVVTVTPATPILGSLRVGRVEAVGEGGSCVAPIDQALFTLHKTSGEPPVIRAMALAGLAPVIRGLHRAEGIPFVETDETERPVLPFREGEDTTDPALLSFMAGSVRYGEGVDPLSLVVQVCTAFDTAKIVVIVRRHRDLAALSGLLTRHGIVPATPEIGELRAIHERVIVTTLQRMGNVEIGKADMVLVLDPLHATWQDPLTAPLAPDPNGPDGTVAPKAVGLLERLIDAGKARVFGFLPSNRTLSPFETARAWQIYGGHELLIPRHGAVVRKLVTAMIPSHTASMAKNGLQYIKNKLRMCHERNRRLARLARALQAGDGDALVRLLPSSKATDQVGVQQHVLVLVENLKQAHGIGKYLPGWPIVSGLGDDSTTVKGDDVEATRGVIATALGVEKLTGDEYDVLVRADPGAGMPPLPVNWLVTEQHPARELLLVDARDTGHRLAALWSRRRHRCYRAAGWSFLGEHPDVTAWMQFRELVLDREERP